MSFASRKNKTRLRLGPLAKPVSRRISKPDEAAIQFAVQRYAAETRSYDLCSICLKQLAEQGLLNEYCSDEATRKDDQILVEEDPLTQILSHSRRRDRKVSDLIVSAGDGCKLCKLLHRVVVRDMLRDMPMNAFHEELDYDVERLVSAGEDGSDEKVLSLSSSLDVTVDFHEERKPDSLIATVWIDSEEAVGDEATLPKATKFPLEKTIYFDLYSSSAASSKSLTDLEPNLDPSSADAYAMVEACMEDCRSTCLSCNHVSENGQVDYPGRVVDVLHSSHNLDLAIRESHGDHLGGYVALSYCWGHPNQPQATTTMNVNTRTKGFKAADMPRTIADAIQVTRRLGFRYLWIDSLCILQDSKEDKNIEIKKMKSIFEGASLTVVAASPSTVNDGFLQKRNPSQLAGISVPFWAEDGRIGKAKLSCRDETADAVEDVVHTRGWTFEEWLLSRRRLCYTRGQMAWSCEGFNKANGGRKSPGMPEYITGNWRRIMEDMTQSFKRAASDLQVSDVWHRLVTLYTQRTLTDSMDRLVAIQGVAQRLSYQRGMKYVYGLWQETVIHDLCWHLTMPQKQKGLLQARERSDLDCPTWSWGSVSFPVVFDTGVYVKSLAEARVANENQSDLLVKGHLLRAESITEHQEEVPEAWDDHAKVTAQDRAVSSRWLINFDLLDGEESKTAQVFMDVPHMRKCTWDFHFLLLLRKLDRPAVHGLVLSQTQGRQQCFQRVGFFTCDDLTPIEITRLSCESFVLI